MRKFKRHLSSGEMGFRVHLLTSKNFNLKRYSSISGCKKARVVTNVPKKYLSSFRELSVLISENGVASSAQPRIPKIIRFFNPSFLSFLIPGIP